MMMTEMTIRQIRFLVTCFFKVSNILVPLVFRYSCYLFIIQEVVRYYNGILDFFLIFPVFVPMLLLLQTEYG